MLPETDETVAMDEPRALKVRIPVSLHVKLYSLRLMTGTSISETVAAALAHHFDHATVRPLQGS
ncbi:MAG TPA: hypothetical protein VNZ52_13040 [Candidatus Thermoplasmatota archaeon]|nr:hypothetical protein [Candidatus Thermoplasmatota archaeon]